jgi:site-specific recombinase XerD
MSIEQSNSSFGEAFRGFLLAKSAENVTLNMVKLYQWTRDYFVRRFGAVALSAVGPDEIRTFLIWLQGKDDSEIQAPKGKDGGLAGASIDIHWRNLKAFFNWCEAEELIGPSPMRKVKRPRFEQMLPEALTELEVVHLLESVKADGDRNSFRDYVVHLFLLDTGVRLAELNALDLDAVDFELGFARVMGKGRKERIVPLGLELRRDLHRYIVKHRRAGPGEKALFVNEHGFRLERGGIQTMVIRDLKRYVGRELKRYGPHTHRHTFATVNLRGTHDLKTTSMILGHSTTRTTERYTHLTGTDVLRNSAGSPMDDLIRGRRNGRDTSHASRKVD